MIEDVLKWDVEAFPSIKESKFYHDEQLADHTLSCMEGAYKELLDNLETTPEIIYEDKSIELKGNAKGGLEYGYFCNFVIARCINAITPC